jgi:serine/threonine-protein kinase RsbW
LISLLLETGQDKVRLTIRDNGKYFPPDQAAVPDLEAAWEDRRVGGLGLYLVKGLMDNVAYSKNEENVNQLILEKGISWSK